MYRKKGHLAFLPVSQVLPGLARPLGWTFRRAGEWRIILEVLPTALNTLDAAHSPAMVNRRISTDMKECALRLWTAGWDEDDIAAAFSVSRSSLFRWKAIFAVFGSIKKPPSPLAGRTRIITRAVLTAVHQIYTTSSDTYVDELVWWLAIHHDIVICHSTLHRNLQEAGLTRKLLHKLALERDEVLRLEWKEFILEHGQGNGKEFAVVDDTS